MFPGHGAGKGDGDRSPGWRNNYDSINWGGKPEPEVLPGDPLPPTLIEVPEFELPIDPDGFVQVSPGHKRKVY